MDKGLTRDDYEEVTREYGGHVSKALGSRYLGMSAKWQGEDIIIGMSDIDYRVILDPHAGVDDWIKVDRACGEIHATLAARCRRWWRVLEHTPGAGLTTAHLVDDHLYHPEYRFWHVAAGPTDLLDPMNERLETKDWEIRDELYHLKRFLYFYSPYQQGIDPPINLEGVEAEYDLHSRCWHYFTPAMLSAASLLAGRRFRGKKLTLRWLQAEHPRETIFSRVLDMVEARYKVPERTDLALRDAFDAEMFAMFEQLKGPVRESLRLLSWPEGLDMAAMKQRLTDDPSAGNARMALTDAVRFARIRLGRYLFYLDPPDGFDSAHPLKGEAMWVKVVYGTPLRVGAAALGIEPGDRSAEEIFAQMLGRALTAPEKVALDAMARLAAMNRSTDEDARRAFSHICTIYLDFYRLLEEYAGRLFEHLGTR